MTALRSLWNGTLRLEAVQAPVALAATRGGGDLSLRTLHRPCSHPIGQQVECPVHGQVPAEELVAGWEVAPGEFVLVEQEELDQLTATPTDRTIHVLQAFVTEELDPTLVRSTYWLMPAGGEFARRAYATIAAGLAAKNALLVQFNYRGEKRGAIRRVDGGVLLLQVLAAAADRHPSQPIADEVADAKVPPKEARLARQLIAKKLAPLDESLIVNTRRQALRVLLESKLAGGAETVTPDPAAVAVTGGVAQAPADLFDALQRSIAQLEGGGIAA